MKHAEDKFFEKKNRYIYIYVCISLEISGGWLLSISQLPITLTQISFHYPSATNYFSLLNIDGMDYFASVSLNNKIL